VWQTSFDDPFSILVRAEVRESFRPQKFIRQTVHAYAARRNFVFDEITFSVARKAKDN
jgi:hypothetical protein